MNKPRLIAMGSIGAVLMLVLAWVWLTGESSAVDTALVDEAAQAAREGSAQEPLDTSPVDAGPRPTEMAPNQ